MAAPADGGLLHRATALVPSLASADPCARPATQLLTLLWKDSLRSCLFSVPMSRFSFCSPQFRLFDVFALLCLRFSYTLQYIPTGQQEPGAHPAHQPRQDLLHWHACEVSDHERRRRRPCPARIPRSTWALHSSDGWASPYSSCQFHHSYGGV